MRCGKCGEEGHVRKNCTNKESTYTFINEEGETKVMCVPKAYGDAAELYSSGIASDINFSKYDAIPSQCPPWATTYQAPSRVSQLQACASSWWRT